MNTALLNSHVQELPLLGRGKVRDNYDLGDALLSVAADRIYCFDVVLPTPIPDKGAVLAQMSRFWFHQTKSIVRNYLESLGWSKQPPAHHLPAEVVLKTSEKYHEAVQCVTGSELLSTQLPKGGETL